MNKHLISLLAILLTTAAIAHQHETAVVPAAEKAVGAQLGIDGPTETKGVEYARKLGSIDLGEEFSPMKGFVMRMREVSLAPGGQVAVHQHTSRPGMAYILEGEAVEYRSDEAEPQVRKAGDAAIESSGIIHWWINKGSVSARVVIVDILKEEDA
ncbi:MAG: cupin domain-containing protein [Puniceicoccaceae bacterium]